MHRSVTSSVIAAISALVLLATAVGAQTPTVEWVNFFSSHTTLDGEPVPVGAVIQAFDPTGVLCGQFTVITAGSYGFMPCYVDDLNTPLDEGIRPGDTVSFTINGLSAGQFTVPLDVSNGDAFEVDLAATTPTPTPTPMPTPTPPFVIPEPLTITMVGLGLAGLAGYVRRQRRQRQDS